MTTPCLYYTPKQLRKQLKQGGRTHGQSCPPTRNAQNNGALGEELVAAILDRYVNVAPHVHVCHSVALHDSTVNGETDHILITPTHIILVETKLFGGYSEILRNPYRDRFDGVNRSTGVVRPVKDSHIFFKIRKYQTRFPNLIVRGVIALVNTDTVIPETGKGDLVELTHAHNLRRTITAMLPVSTHPPAVGVGCEYCTSRSRARLFETVTYFAENCQRYIT